MNELYAIQSLLAKLQSDDAATIRAAEEAILNAVRTALRVRPQSAIQFYTIASDVAELAQYEEWLEQDNQAMPMGCVRHQERTVALAI